MIAVSFDDGTFTYQAVGFRTGSMHSLVNSDLEFAFAVEFFVKVHVAVAAARILDLCPAKSDAPFVSENRRLLVIAFGGRRHLPSNQTLRVIQEHSRRLTCF